MEFAIKSFYYSWVENHPSIIWLLQHPIISLISILLIITLFFRLFFAIAQLLDRLWIWLLKSPILLLKSVLGIKGKSSETISEITLKELTIEPEKIGQIIEQLETINRQQQQIIKDIALLKEKQKDSPI